MFYLLISLLLAFFSVVNSPRAKHNDLRLAVVWQRVVLNRPRNWIVEHTPNVASRTVSRWVRRFREYQSVLPDWELFPDNRGRNSIVTLNDIAIIIEELWTDPTLYRDEIRNRLIARGGSTVSVGTIKYWMKILGITRKKLWRWAKSARLSATILYFHHLSVSQYDPLDLIFIDESSVNDRTANRLFGYAFIGTRAVFRCALVRGTRYSLAAAVNANGILDYMLVQGSCTGHIFFQWFTNSLYYHMNGNSVLVMDNAAVHRYGPLLDIFEFLDVGVIFLPPYSPFLNPAEHLWVAVKSAVRRHREQLLANPETTLAVIMEHYRNFDFATSMRRMGYGSVLDMN
eukprot:374426_1